MVMKCLQKTLTTEISWLITDDLCWRGWLSDLNILLHERGSIWVSNSCWLDTFILHGPRLTGTVCFGTLISHCTWVNLWVFVFHKHSIFHEVDLSCFVQSQSQKLFILQRLVMRVSNIKKHYPSSQHPPLPTRIHKREVWSVENSRKKK